MGYIDLVRGTRDDGQSAGPARFARLVYGASIDFTGRQSLANGIFEFELDLFLFTLFLRIEYGACQCHVRAVLGSCASGRDATVVGRTAPRIF